MDGGGILQDGRSFHTIVRIANELNGSVDANNNPFGVSFLTWTVSLINALTAAIHLIQQNSTPKSDNSKIFFFSLNRIIARFLTTTRY